jgi:hypothetical protein
LRATLASTPGRLTASLVLLFLIVAAFGATAITGVVQRQSLISSVRTSSGPLTVQAEVLYRSMSDADATAASAFLSVGAEPPALRARYLDDIQASSAALVNAAAGSASDRRALQQISTGLPMYAGLVETARADNRLGLPLGAAYLREASALMRNTLLPAASTLYESETGSLADDRDSAAGFPWIAIPLGLIAVALLFRAQRMLARRTRRLLNPGLVLATLAVIVALGWLAISWTADTSALHASNVKGSAQVDALAQARIAALRSRADEALTLVARGNGAAFQDDFTATMARLQGTRKAGGLLASAQDPSGDPVAVADARAAAKDLAAWQAVHTAIRSRDDSGSYPDAVQLAIGTGDSDAPALFSKVDTDLSHGIDAANATFTSEATTAANALAGADVAAGVLTALALIGLSVGFQRRIAEYR